jgi:hypothetical protein
MRHSNQAVFWAVYQRAWKFYRTEVMTTAVCEQGEWDAMQKAEPGVRLLVRGRIGSEEEAEKLARGTSGDTYRGGGRSGSIRTLSFG